MGKLVDGIWVDWIEKVKVLQKAVIQNNDGLFLALKRGQNEKTRPNYWDLCGGSVEQEDVKLDEALVKALAREIFEEVNLKLKSSKIIHVSPGFDDKKGVFIVALAYLCTVKNENDLKLNANLSLKTALVSALNKGRLRELNKGLILGRREGRRR